MVKKFFLTAAVAGLLIGATAIVQAELRLWPAGGCWKLAQRDLPLPTARSG